jgi:hypothetical protein
MKRIHVLALAVAIAIGTLAPAVVNGQDCNYWRCFNEGTSLATCDLTFCYRLPCEGMYFALSCSVRCDVGGGGGGCYCVPSGQCYDI